MSFIIREVKTRTLMKYNERIHFTLPGMSIVKLQFLKEITSAYRICGN